MPRRPSKGDDCRECVKLRARVRELEHEVERLTRKVARERKHKGREPVQVDDDEPQSLVPDVAPATACPKCGSEVKDFPTAYKTIVICTNKRCLWRKTS